MDLFKYKLPNGNMFIWLGTGEAWAKSKGIDNVLILSGGDVLFLTPAKTLPLQKEEVREDLENLSYEEFSKKYDLPINGELWTELKMGVKTGKYPSYRENFDEAIWEYRDMLFQYISVVSRLRDPKERIRQLQEIIRECQKRILEAERNPKT